MNHSTPGVYIEESTALPMSLEAVSTAIPAFIGMTEKCDDKYKGKPIKVNSLLEYENLFGTAPAEPLNVNLTDNKQDPIQVELASSDGKLNQIMYYNLQLFFNNGGGTCFIVSLGEGDGSESTPVKYKDAIKSLEKKPEITLLTLTDVAYYLSVDYRREVYKDALEHCNKMQNRMVIFDAEYEKIDGASGFRECVGTEQLQYGAAYTPYLNTSLNPVVENNGDYSVTVFGEQQILTTDQFVVTYSGDKDEAFFEVDDISQGDPDIIVTENIITIRFDTDNTVKDVIEKWKEIEKRHSFELEKKDGVPDDNLVNALEKTGFDRLSGFSESQNGLVVSYKGSEFFRPSVVIVEDSNLTESPDIKVCSGCLTVKYKDSCTNQEVIDKAGSFLLGFSVTLKNEVDSEEMLSEGRKTLARHDIFTASICALQISYIGREDAPEVEIITNDTVGEVVSLIEQTAVKETAAKPKATRKRTSKKATGENADTITFEANGGKLTITCPKGKTSSDLIDAWKNETAKGDFSIIVEASDSGPTDITDKNQSLYKVTNSIKLSELATYNTQKENQILAAIKSKAKIKAFPPSGAIAGIYNKVDEQRGIWQSPANISLNSVIAPAQSITAAQQACLNEDPTTGKSINAIRPFLGKGSLVWGARTLDGNSNDWRYISVRRLISFIESSIKNALQNYVFESNNAMTWLQVRAMIEPFLENLWQQGALVGSKANDAFFVNIGLGTTMTPQDILEGRMKISIGLAAVRPAEFIVLEVTQLQQN